MPAGRVLCPTVLATSFCRSLAEIIFLCLKDGRRIPLTPSNQLNDLLFLEGRAIFIAKLLKVELKLNNR